MSSAAKSMILSAGAIAMLFAAPAAAEWRPSKPIEFVATAGPGGGTDNLARAVQNSIVKYKLTDQPVVVVNKGGGSGAEGYTYGKASAGDPYKAIFGTSNAWQQPMVSRVAFKHTDLTPIAAMAQDEFLLWVKQDAPYKTVGEYLKAVAAKPGEFKMGGAQSKDTDEVLTRMIEKTANVKFTYIPFKSGAEAAVQLAGGHVDSHVNNPSESLGSVARRHAAPVVRLQLATTTTRPEDHCNGGLARHPHLRRIWPEHSEVPAAAHGLAPRQDHAGSGGLLRRTDEEGASHARVEGIHRAHVADRHVFDRRGVREVHEGGHRARAQDRR
jgi:tripartite-type tricarboxylate transporter receptor subunit TctC